MTACGREGEDDDDDAGIHTRGHLYANFCNTDRGRASSTASDDDNDGDDRAINDDRDDNGDDHHSHPRGTSQQPSPSTAKQIGDRFPWDRNGVVVTELCA